MTTQENLAQEEGHVEGSVTEVPVEKLESVAPDPFVKGRERIAAIGGFFTKAKEKFNDVKKQAGATLSRFWSRTKSAAGETAAAVFSVDDLAAKGAQYAGGKINQADQWMGQKAEQAGELIGEKGSQAVGWAGDKLEQSYDWTQEKAAQAEAFVDKNWEKAKEFTASKAEQVKTFAAEKVEVVKDIAFYAKEKTNEGLDKAKEGIKNRWGQMVSFGEGAIAEGKLKMAQAKESYRNTMNAMRERRLRAEYEKAVAKESEASEKALILKAKREALEGKMGLLQGLELSAAA